MARHPALTLNAMNFRRLPPDPAREPDDAWAQTRPSALYAPEPRRQPPLREVLQGLDSRVLEGETVFDQLFGALPDGPGHAAPGHQPNSQPNGRTPNRR